MSSYVDRLISPQEKVLRRVHQHRFAILAVASRSLLLLLVGLALALAAQAGHWGLASNVGVVVAAIVCLFALIHLVATWVRWNNKEYLVTSWRVIEVSGVFNKVSADSALDKINDVVLRQGMFGQWFGYGTLDVVTAAEAGVLDHLEWLPDPVNFKRAMLEAKHSTAALSLEH